VRERSARTRYEHQVVQLLLYDGQLARAHGVRMPIIERTYDVLFAGLPVAVALADLLAGPPGEEAI